MQYNAILLSPALKTWDEIIIYPDPASLQVDILWCKAVTIVITTLDGKKLKTAENSFYVELGDLPNGEYMIILFDNGKKILARQFTKMAK